MDHCLTLIRTNLNPTIIIIRIFRPSVRSLSTKLTALGILITSQCPKMEMVKSQLYSNEITRFRKPLSWKSFAERRKENIPACIFFHPILNVHYSFMRKNVNKKCFFQSPLIVSRVIGQKWHFFPTNDVIWVVSQVHIQTVALIFVLNTPLMLGFSFIPPLWSLSNVAERAVEAWTW